jgi:hypothetical protein
MSDREVAAESLWNDLRGLLDQKLACLPPRYRAALVRCDTGPIKFYITFVLVNDGDKTNNPELASSALLVNGKELEKGFIVTGGLKKDHSWRALRPKDPLIVAYTLGETFPKPGTYKVAWKGKRFQSPKKAR